MLLLVAAATANFLFYDAGEDANEIMRRLAASVEASVEARRQYVYKQKVNARLVRANGRVSRAEKRVYTVVPGPERTEKTLVSLDGEYHKSKKEIIKYDKPGFEKGGMDIDGGMLEGMVDDLVNDKDTRDGIPHSFFPLSSKDLPAYIFTYRKATEVKGRKAHVIAFEPAKNTAECVKADNCSDRPWKGEVVVDAEEFQPVRVFSDLDFKMPWGVKVFLGTNIRQVGFSVNYTRVAPNVWFPATYGTEFRVDVLFAYKRVITLALDSSEFQRTEAKSDIQFKIDDK